MYVAVSATGWSLVQKSPTVCVCVQLCVCVCVQLCVTYTLEQWGSLDPSWAIALQKNQKEYNHCIINVLPFGVGLNSPN